MRQRITYLWLIAVVITGKTLAQIPVIQKVEPRETFPKLSIVITGSGFNANPAQLQVWFDHVKGKVLSSSEFSIEVEVPAEAKLNNVTVLNLVSRLSASSPLKVVPVFSGEGFDPAKLATPVSISSANAIFDIITSDVDGDGKPDIVGSRFENTATTMALAMNQSTAGNLSFTNTVIPAFSNVNAPTGHLATGDLNGDGKLDIVASRSGATANTVFVFINTSTVGNPSFAPHITLSLDLTHFARHVDIQDLNGDGKPEIIVTNSASSDLYIFKNESSNGNININPLPVKVPVTGATETLGLEIEDLDGDRKPDIIVTRNQNPDLYILRNVSTNTAFNFTVSKITVAGQYNDVITADFNKDGKLDIVTTNLFGAQAQVFLNQTSGNAIIFATFPITLTTDAQPFGVDVCDLNGDGFADFIVACRGSNTLNAYINNGNVSSLGFTKVSVSSTKTNWFVRAGDLDGDAKPDIAFSSFSGSSGPYSVDIIRNRNCHKPKILNTEPLTICASQTIRLNAIPIPGVLFNWNNGFGSIKNSADPFVDITAAATYTVTASAESGTCSVISAPITVSSGAGSLPSDPTITTNSPVCSGSSITLSTPTISGATYIWKDPANASLPNLPNISIPNATQANAGIYSLTIKVGDCSSNTVTKRVDVVSFGNFTISSSVPNNTICQGQSVILTINNESGYAYQWMKDGANISGQTSTSLSVNTEGNYKVKVTNTALGCSQETAEVKVTVFTAPSALFTAPSAGCVGKSITFTDGSTADTRVTTVIYAWNFGDTETSALKNPSHTYNAVQNFTVQLTVSYSGVSGCTSTISKSINIANPVVPVIASTKDLICDGEEATLSVAGTFSSYLWSTTETTPTIIISSAGDYSVITTDANGCEGTDSITINEKPDCEPVSTELKFPKVFTPNGDAVNERWEIENIEDYPDCTMSIYDGRGRKVFEVTGYPTTGWDGTNQGKEVPQGTYYFVFSCPTGNLTTGSVLILR
jgi:gliding motility-associated-like protein